MSGARYTKNGLLIPTDWLKKLGQDVRVQRGDGVVIIESKQRETSRKHLAQLVKKLRQAGEELGLLRQAEIDALVDEVRQVRAGHR